MCLYIYIYKICAFCFDKKREKKPQQRKRKDVVTAGSPPAAMVFSRSTWAFAGRLFFSINSPFSHLTPSHRFFSPFMQSDLQQPTRYLWEHGRVRRRQREGPPSLKRTNKKQYYAIWVECDVISVPGGRDETWRNICGFTKEDAKSRFDKHLNQWHNSNARWWFCEKKGVFLLVCLLFRFFFCSCVQVMKEE